MKFLFDESPSPELTKLAHAKGYGESAHVVWLVGARRTKRLGPKPFILKDDWTFVTKNSVDFGSAAEKPGAKGQYADIAIHAGLICLNGPPGLDLDMQLELFEQALDELESLERAPRQPCRHPPVRRARPVPPRERLSYNLGGVPGGPFRPGAGVKIESEPSRHRHQGGVHDSELASRHWSRSQPWLWQR
jgi:hypothetical protein